MQCIDTCDAFHKSTLSLLSLCVQVAATVMAAAAEEEDDKDEGAAEVVTQGKASDPPTDVAGGDATALAPGEGEQAEEAKADEEVSFCAMRCGCSAADTSGFLY